MPQRARPPHPARILTALGLVAVGLLSGCASARLLQPGDVHGLEPGEGILVMDIDTEIEIEALGFGSATAAHALPRGRHFYLLAVPAGRYRWSRLTIETSSGREFTFLLSREEITYFEVEPGRINYTGRHRFWGRVGEDSVSWGGEIQNRSAEAASRLLEDFREFVDAYPMSFAGSYRDDFLEHLSSTTEQEGALGAAEP